MTLEMVLHLRQHLYLPFRHFHFLADHMFCLDLLASPCLFLVWRWSFASQTSCFLARYLHFLEDHLFLKRCLLLIKRHRHVSLVKPMTLNMVSRFNASQCPCLPSRHVSFYRWPSFSAMTGFLDSLVQSQILFSSPLTCQFSQGPFLFVLWWFFFFVCLFFFSPTYIS